MTGAEASISIVMPVLNEAASIAAAVADARRHAAECLVVDGGSSDRTAALAFEAGAIVIGAPRGRAVQMNAGAERARSDVLLFVHADCRLPDHAAQSIRAAIASGAAWGRFDVRLDSPRRSLRLVGAMMNWRSRLSGIATGDQAMFLTRTLYDSVGGFAPIPLMEDIDLSARLRRIARPACLRDRVLVSARRWEQRGVVRTVLEMWLWRG
ncbi:MAG: TIGR04283 family arsenosugar biosynthesis glycosyltransferase, partial [Acidobacteria bacterium]|nr:TIGR04283 family arsenosugar biosynthesis glycosyltransferase [Acidobacteriota bacterium]